MADGRRAVKIFKRLRDWLESVTPAQEPLSELAKKARRLKRRINRRGGSVKHRMAMEARKKLG
jgi:hypothetical protein